MLPFGISDLEKAVAEGDVTKRPHPTLPLWIYNYGPEVQYRNKWNDVTLNCRGLILDDDYNIVARPWKKFFNLGQVNLPIQLTDPVEVMDKADGSLGILYPTPEGYAVATRGSFQSEQAIHATKLWREEYAMYHDFNIGDEIMDDYTFLFEIVYPENRIVLNYDGLDDLIMLGAVQKSTGYYVGPRQASAMLGWMGPVVEVFEHKNISEALAHMDRPNAEGYVIRSHNFMVKLKQPDYLDLHRLVTNMTPKTIWEKLRDGQSVGQICADLPDEFHQMAKDFAEPLLAAYSRRSNEIMNNYYRVIGEVDRKFLDSPTFPSRKDFAMAFKSSQDARYYFSILDGKPIHDILWNELKPKETIKEIACVD